MDSVELMRRDKPKKRALTEEEIKYVRTANLPIREKTFVILLLTTGLRRGEALALMRNDIDMERRIVRVNKTVIVKKNKMEIEERTKTAAGMRDVPITDELYGYLAEYLPTLQTIYLFPTARNNFMSDTAFGLMWDKIIEAMNIAAGGKTVKRLLEKEDKHKGGRRKVETVRVMALADDITPHTFRHTYATLLYEAGVDVKVAQHLLGHSSLQVTMDIYTDLSDKKKEGEIGKFNTYMNDSIQSKISQAGHSKATNTAK